MAALTHHSQKAILNIISEMTRPITDVLGEPPLTPLEAHSKKLRRQIPTRAKDTPSEADILVITRSYRGPNSFLKGGRLSSELAEPRKRPRVEKDAPDSVARKRRREEKPPRPEATITKREGEIIKKPKTEDTKPRPLGIKLTSQPAPRQNDEIRKASRPADASSLRKRESFEKETRRQVKEDPEDAHLKDMKEPSRKRPLVIPRSALPPLRSVAAEKPRTEVERQKAKTKETENEKTRSSTRVRPTEKIERKRREDMLRSSAKDSPAPSTSSSERRRPRSRPMDSDAARPRDSETDRELERRDKRRIRERDRDIESDRERPSKDRERERVRDRNNQSKESGSRSDQKKESRDVEREYNHRENERSSDAGRGISDKSTERKKEVTKDRERARVRSSVPLSKPDSGRDSGSAGGSPAEVRSIPLSSKPIVRSPVDIGARSAQPQQSTSGLQENIAKQKEMKEEFLDLVDKCKELNRNKDYDAYEEMSKRAFRNGFELGLTMEAELRLDAARYKALSANKRSLRNRPIIVHYRTLTKTYAEKWQNDFDRLGRVNAVSFFKRSTRKVYFRMFIVHHQWNKEMLYTYRGLEDMLDKAVKGRNSGKSNKEKEEELPTRKLETLLKIVKDHSNICSIFDGIATDFGGGYEDPGAESYIP